MPGANLDPDFLWSSCNRERGIFKGTIYTLLYYYQDYETITDTTKITQNNVITISNIWIKLDWHNDVM